MATLTTWHRVAEDTLKTLKNDCAICQELVEQDAVCHESVKSDRTLLENPVRITHIFHQKCIKKSIYYGNSRCPNCCAIVEPHSLFGKLHAIKQFSETRIARAATAALCTMLAIVIVEKISDLSVSSLKTMGITSGFVYSRFPQVRQRSAVFEAAVFGVFWAAIGIFVKYVEHLSQEKDVFYSFRTSIQLIVLTTVLLRNTARISRYIESMAEGVIKRVEGLTD